MIVSINKIEPRIMVHTAHKGIYKLLDIYNFKAIIYVKDKEQPITNNIVAINTKKNKAVIMDEKYKPKCINCERIELQICPYQNEWFLLADTSRPELEEQLFNSLNKINDIFIIPLLPTE